jgi:hypothetical protein
MRVAELAERLQVPYRDVRYVLEQGILPRGVEESPGRGEHRELSLPQAYWLAIVLLLKQFGMRTPGAGEFADLTRDTVRWYTQNLGYEHSFQPFIGQFETEYEWYVEIGDMKYFRVVSSVDDNMNNEIVWPWSDLTKRKIVNSPKPLVVLRLDLTRLARLMTA